MGRWSRVRLPGPLFERNMLLYTSEVVLWNVSVKVEWKQKFRRLIPGRGSRAQPEKCTNRCERNNLRKFSASTVRVASRLDERLNPMPYMEMKPRSTNWTHTVEHLQAAGVAFNHDTSRIRE